MDYRIGNCSSCGAVYKLPASFAHDNAKCKQCGGVVEIGKAQAAAAVKPALEEVKVDPNKKRSGPSMKEKILARKRAEEAAANAPQVPARAPARKPTAAPPVASRPAATRPAASRPAAAVEAELEAEGPAPKRRSGAKRSGSGSRSGSGGRRGGSKSSARGGAAGRERNKKKSAGPLIGGVVGMVAVAGGALFLFRDDIFPSDPSEEVQAADVSTNAAGAASSAPVEPAADPVSEDAPATESPESSETTDEPEAVVEETPEETKEIAVDDPNDPLLDLSTLPEFGPVDATSQEQFDEWTTDMAKVIDPDAGASAARAQRNLVTEGRRAFPVILNAARGLDLTTDEGRNAGDLIQRMLTEIIDGQNYGWHYSDSVADAKFNSKVLRTWASAWEKAENDIEQWIRMARLDDSAAAALRAEQGGESPEVAIDEDADLFEVD